MTKQMLIDAVHAEETRVVVVDGTRIEELDFESQSRRQLRGNIYLAKVTRVEPSLQAAFVEYGGNRHGFLAFNEIHPDYYQIPVADREALMREVDADHGEDDDHDDADRDDDDSEDEADRAFERRQRRLMRRYKIQEVLRRRQIMLVQVVKEERGNKGAALTTYLSLAGRYGVLMPNTARGGGISRKITSATDRRRLKTVVQGLDVPQGMGLIVRTAGAKRTKAEISRDYDYLLRLWEDIREKTLKSIAPALIYEEEDLVKRAIRDMFDKDLDGILVEGEAGFREARNFMRMIMPSQAGKIRPYREATPLFVAHRIEDQLAQIHSPVVPLRSGGYLVINQTEALVAIDVNSGKATRERNVEATAFKTNLEAAEEAARQLRLRDLAGLIVIDFIDMEEGKNNRAVEKVLKDALSQDRARVQMGKISGFGLMEISRQRRRSGVLEGTTHVCEHCQGMGRVRSVESSALAALRAVEVEAAKGGAGLLNVRLPTAVGLYVLNEKRAYLARLEQLHGLELTILTDDALSHVDVEVERVANFEGEGRPVSRRAPVFPPPEPEVEDEPFVADDLYDDDDVEDDLPETDHEVEVLADEDEDDREVEHVERGDDGGRRRRRRRRGRRDEEEQTPVEAEHEDDEAALDAADEGGEDDGSDGDEGEHRRRRRRRGRRGGRRLREEGAPRDVYAWVHPHGGRDQPHPKDDPYAWRDAHAGARGEAGGEVDFERPRAATPAPASLIEAAPTAPIGGGQGEADIDPYVWTAPDGSAGDAGGDASADRDRTRGRNRRGRGGRGRNRRDRESSTPNFEASEGQDGASTSAETDAELEQPGDFQAEDTPSSEAFGPAQVVDEGDVAAPITEDQTVPDAEIAPEQTLPPSDATARDARGDGPDLTGASLAEPSSAAARVEPVRDDPEPAPPALPPQPDPAEITGKAAAPRRGWWRRGG